MKARSYSLRFGWRAIPLAVVAALVAAVPAMPQSSSSSSTTEDYSIVDVGASVGSQWFRDKGIKRLAQSALINIHVDENFTNYVGLEESLSLGFNQIRLLPYQENQFAPFSEKNWQGAITGMFYLTPRDARFRPFFTFGPGYVWYVPGAAKPFEEKNSPSLVYGIGLKGWMTKGVAFRADLRGLWTKTPHFGLPDHGINPGDLYVPRGGTEKGIQATIGLDFGFRRHHVEAPPPPAPVVEKKPEPVMVQVAGIEGAHDVCPGEDERLSIAPSASNATYQWMVDGEPAPGANGTSFSLPTAGASGTKSVTVKVTVGDQSKTSEPVTVRIKDLHAPSVTFSISPTTIPQGGKAQLSASATSSECGGASTIGYTASEGTISGDTYDSSSVQFDMSNRSKAQSKVVHLTATATDQKGQTGSATADLTVTLSPEARRLEDIVYPLGSARVNNCGKRLLLEELSPMLRDDPGATVILIGHRDTQEKGKAAAKLDEVRVINAAAVLSAGTGICPQLELSRVKVNWVGTDQTSTPNPSLCGESTNVKERSGQAIKASDKRAEYRRVEVWVVPSGAEMPAAAGAVKDAPASEIKAKGCPK